MKKEIIELRRSYAVATRILNSLAADRDVPRILKGLRAQEDLASIARLIDSSPTPEPETIIADSPMTEDYSESSYSSIMDTTSPEDSQTSYAAESQVWSDMISSPSTMENPSGSGPWRSPVANELLIKHLLSLYWVWIHPAHPILDMAQFFQEYENGGTTHCSAYLVNAICAAACDLLNPEWQQVPGKRTDVAALRQRLIAETTIQATMADPEGPTTAQASAVISLLHTRTVRTASTGFGFVA